VRKRPADVWDVRGELLLKTGDKRSLLSKAEVKNRFKTLY
jgi:hypothetical protein